MWGAAEIAAQSRRQARPCGHCDRPLVFAGGTDGTSWTVAAFFIERAVSGSVPLADRPEGRKLLAAAGKGDVIITAKLDRAFRSAADALAVLEEFKDQGIALHMIDLDGDVTGNGISKMVFTILAAVAEGERDRLRERIRDAKRHLTSPGVFSGGRRPFGFDLVCNTDGAERR
jgi:putative DNA-invertase from lambdoid prophage Rac